MLPDEDGAFREYRLGNLGAAECWDEYWDEVAGANLPAYQVRKARAEEVAFMEDWKCWKRVSKEEAYRCGGRRPIATRWVDVNKGDSETPDV